MSTPLHQLAHEVIGDGPNPLVFVHGFTQTRTSWRTVAQAVVAGVPASRAMLIDLPGHGESQQVVADIAESARLITECGGQATYIGYSLGARVVLHALINQPNAVQRAVVISGTAGLVTPAERDERVAADELLAQRIEAIGVEAFVDEWLALPLFADVPLAALSEATRQKLDAVLPANWSHSNPVDIIGDAPVTRYQQALAILNSDPNTGALLFIHAPTAIVPSADIAQALVPLAQHDPHMAPRLMSCWLGDAAVAQARKIFQDAGVASYDTPEQAVRAFSMLLRYRHNQSELTQAPPATLANQRPDSASIRHIVQAALAAGRALLSEPEAKAVLQACGIPVVATQRVAATADAAAQAATALGFPVVLKILSDDISHKSDVGGVALNLADEAALRHAADTMLARVQQQLPLARVQGFTVQRMVQRRHAQELIVGSAIDPVFGPVILFGQGGTAVELMADRAVALPPLNVPLARALVARTRVARLLAAWRDTPAVDADALHGVLMAVSQLLAEIPEIAELDINPLIVNFEGAIALDARIRLSAAGPAGADNFAIRPYPAQLEEQLLWQGRSICLRPIRPEDEAQHMAFLQALDPEDVRMRVFYSRRSIARSELARLVQIDYAREMAFVALADGPNGQVQTLGVVRAMTDPDNIEAEFGVIVRSDLKGSGLGLLLMQKMIAYLRSQGTQRLVATVLDYNDRMLKLARELGFEEGAIGTTGDGVRGILLKLT